MSSRLIEWVDGYPTEESLERLRVAVNDRDFKKAAVAFYSALCENIYPDCCGIEQKEVRGKLIDVWAYHTLGWSGNESIIGVLQDSPLWDMFLERHDKGGHYYFTLRKEAKTDGRP